MSEVSVILAGLSGTLLMKVVFILPVEMKAVIIKLSWNRKLSSLKLCYKALLSEVGSCPFFNQCQYYSYRLQVLAKHLWGSPNAAAPGQLILQRRKKYPNPRLETGTYMGGYN